jgi:hypothetical protein
MNGWWLFYALIRFFFQYWCAVYHRFGPYFCEPIIAGLNEDGTPFICTTDLIGAKYENSCYFLIPVWFDSSLDSVLCSPSCSCTVRWFLHDVAPWTQIDEARISNHELRSCCGGQVRGDARPLRGSEVNFKWKNGLQPVSSAPFQTCHTWFWWWRKSVCATYRTLHTYICFKLFTHLPISMHQCYWISSPTPHGQLCSGSDWFYTFCLEWSVIISSDSLCSLLLCRFMIAEIWSEIWSCRQLSKDFVVSGTASESLYGACESMYKPDLVRFHHHFGTLCISFKFVV